MKEEESNLSSRSARLIQKNPGRSINIVAEIQRHLLALYSLFLHYLPSLSLSLL